MREAEYDRSDSLDALLPADERTPIGNAVGRSIVQGDDAALAQALAQLRDVPREGPPAMWIALYAGDPSAARQAIETFEASEAGRASEAARTRASSAIVNLELTLGRWQAAEERMNVVPAASAAFAQRIRLQVALLPFMPIPDDDLREIRSAVEAGDSISDRSAAHAAEALRSEERLYAIAAISCRLGEHDRALALAKRLEAAEVPPQYQAITQRLAGEIRVQVAARRGDARQALALLEKLDPTTMLELYWSPIGGAHNPYWRAELLYQLGRDDDALVWLENGFASTAIEHFTYGYTNLRQGEIYERTGDRTAAAKHYAKAITYWGDADAPLQSEVTRARERLAALTGEQ